MLCAHVLRLFQLYIYSRSLGEGFSHVPVLMWLSVVLLCCTALLACCLSLSHTFPRVTLQFHFSKNSISCQLICQLISSQIGTLVQQTANSKPVEDTPSIGGCGCTTGPPAARMWCCQHERTVYYIAAHSRFHPRLLHQVLQQELSDRLEEADVESLNVSRSFNCRNDLQSALPQHSTSI